MRGLYFLLPGVLLVVMVTVSGVATVLQDDGQPTRWEINQQLMWREQELRVQFLELLVERMKP